LANLAAFAMVLDQGVIGFPAQLLCSNECHRLPLSPFPADQSADPTR
jgi:hypothetical protein